MQNDRVLESKRGATAFAMKLALEQLIDHARSRASVDVSDCNLFAESMETILEIARRGGFVGQAADVVEVFVDSIGDD